MNSPSGFQGHQPKSTLDFAHYKITTPTSPTHILPKNGHYSQQNSFGCKKTQNQNTLTSSYPGIIEGQKKQSFKAVPQSNVMSPKNNSGTSKPMPPFLQSKYAMKASLMGEDFSKNLPTPSIQSPKRPPRMSQHGFHQDIKSSTIEFGEVKMPAFLQKNDKQKEPAFRKKHQNQEHLEDKEDQVDHTLSESGSSVSTFIGDQSDKMLMKKSTYDPTTAWIKQSWSKKKEKKFSISDFVQIKELGAGKYGHVYLVKEKKSNFVCALKIIEKKLLKEEQITEQFIRELKIQMYLNHSNIIKMYGFFDDNVNIYIILEVGTGGQLFKHLKKSQSMPENKVAFLMRQICQATNQIHSNQIIHRDLKPENIVMHDNVVKLCDFGWSVHMDKNLRTTFCGTPLYVSPEILRGKDYDEKIDIWSLGVMMYEMVVGENPFKITKEEELVKIVKDAVVIPSYVDLSKEAKDFLDCCLQKNPEQRSNIRQLLNHSFFKKYPEKSDKKMGI